MVGFFIASAQRCLRRLKLFHALDLLRRAALQISVFVKNDDWNGIGKSPVIAVSSICHMMLRQVSSHH